MRLAYRVAHISWWLVLRFLEIVFMAYVVVMFTVLAYLPTPESLIYQNTANRPIAWIILVKPDIKPGEMYDFLGKLLDLKYLDYNGTLYGFKTGDYITFRFILLRTNGCLNVRVIEVGVKP